MKHLLLLIIYVLPTFAFAQDQKIEKEEGVNMDQMPEDAQVYLENNLPENIRRLKFYYETDGDKESYEAKFKYKGHRYSVEFDENGKLEDIEVEVKKRHLDKKALKNIEDFLRNKHQRHKIEKIQAQFLISEQDKAGTMQRARKLDQSEPDNLELIVATKNDGKLKKYEILFDALGNLKSEREIIRNSYDYLIF